MSIYLIQILRIFHILTRNFELYNLIFRQIISHFRDNLTVHLIPTSLVLIVNLLIQTYWHLGNARWASQISEHINWTTWLVPDTHAGFKTLSAMIDCFNFFK